jgi:DNA (cytosine-5)-methyltransferase 1
VNLTFGELFAGVGGFSLGFEQAGWRCRWQVEWDKHCQGVLARHWPQVARYGDVQHCDGNQLAPVDCITFGSPCQDLSVAGKRAGLAGERSGLFHEAIRIIKEMRDATAGTFPRYAIWENVAGALSSNKGDDFLAVIDAFAEIGAVDVAWRLVDAQFFGVPQRRRRVFVVADFAGECAGALHVEPAGVRWHPAAGRTAGQETAGTFGVSVAGTLGSATGGFRTTDLDGIGAYVPVAEAYSRTSFAGYTAGIGTLATTDHKRPDMHVVPYPIQGTLIGRSEHAGPQGLGVGQPDGPMYTLDRVSQHAAAFVKVIRSGARDADGNLPPEVWREEPVAPTLNQFDNNSESRATVIVPATAVRRLTPVECERLMGWPDDHTRWRADGTEQADSHRYRQCGNGVAAPVAAWLAWNLRTATEQDLNKGDNQ